MREEWFDQTLKNALKEKTKNCSMSDERRRTFLDQVHQVNKEELNMKHVSKKKLLIAIAAMCLMASMVVVAAGKISFYESSTSTENPDFATFADIKDVKEELGYSVRAVEQFANGVKFDKGFISKVDGLDENGNKIDTFLQLTLDYKKGSSSALMYTSTEEDQTMSLPQQSEVVNNKTLNYYENQYLFLPPDVKPSAEDLALETEGKLFISYGSSKVERQTCNSIVWMDGEVQYMILSWDFSGQELIDMAKEVANAEIAE